MIGSAALSLCYVASGSFDVYQEERIKLWDVAAGLAIINALNINYEANFLEDYLMNVKVFNIYL